MLKNFRQSTLFFPIVWVLACGVVNFVLLRFWDFDQTQATVIGIGIWIFAGVAGLYVKLEQSMATATGAAALAKYPDLKKALLGAVSIYDSMTEPMLRHIVEKQLLKVADHEFSKNCSLRLTHQEYGSWLPPYIRDNVVQIRAFSKSWVTNWTRFGAVSNNYLHAQKGKDVVRIFVLEDAQEYELFAATVFPKHAAVYGAANVCVISKEQAIALVRDLPSGVAYDEDFAIFDDRAIAFCKGDDVRVRADKLEACRSVFATVRGYAKSFEQLQTDAAAVSRLFHPTSATT